MVPDVPFSHSERYVTLNIAGLLVEIVIDERLLIVDGDFLVWVEGANTAGPLDRRPPSLVSLFTF